MRRRLGARGDMFDEASQDALGNLRTLERRQCGPTGEMALWRGRRPRSVHSRV